MPSKANPMIRNWIRRHVEVPDFLHCPNPVPIGGVREPVGGGVDDVMQSYMLVEARA
jgi:hypothetical protein